MEIDLLEVARLRLRNQRVTGEKFATAAEVVAWLGCVQSQEYSLAKWSLGMRAAPGVRTARDGGVTLREADVDAALATGEILRTHILRPTWHYVAPADVRDFMRLTGPRVLSGSAGRMRRLEIDDRQLATAYDVFAEALQGNKHLTRPELRTALAQVGLETDGQRLTYIVMAAEMGLLICSGAPRPNNKATYALLDEVASPSSQDKQPFDRDRAIAKLTLRYFTSHGPATVPDFTWWSGLTAGDARRGLDINGAALESLDVAGTNFWWAGDVGGSADPPPSPAVYLMQAYDEYVVAYRSPRHPINLGGLAPPAVLQSPAYYHSVFVDTQLVGFWRRLAVKDGYRVETRMLRDLTEPEHDAFDAALQRCSDFAQRPVTLAD